MFDSPLMPEEVALMHNAVAARRREFAAGRACARNVISQLAKPVGPIGRTPVGAPVWPAGIVGSISHAQPICCAVATVRRHALGLGIDVEIASEIPDGTEMLICSSEELMMHPTSQPDGASWIQIAFSAKEAAYKAISPILGRHVSFDKIFVRFAKESSVNGSFNATLDAHRHLHECRGRWRVENGVIFAGVTMAPGED